jgi:hypothetical protein
VHLRKGKMIRDSPPGADFAQVDAHRSPLGGRLTAAQQFTAGDDGVNDFKSVKRTADSSCSVNRSLMQFQASASRTLPVDLRNPSDESLGYYHSSAIADWEFGLFGQSCLNSKLPDAYARGLFAFRHAATFRKKSAVQTSNGKSSHIASG